MTDIASILSASYKSNLRSTARSNSRYVAVYPTLYIGAAGAEDMPTGSRSRSHAFRIGDTKFTPAGNAKAQIKNVVTDAASGQTYLDTAYAIRSR
ncbi:MULTISPECIES: hypothetical protein [unclassified Bradyrhizobium]|uniref:hypothetical protein n=1 Tax=unclassified Bradyrhizobium TaxID=2631580 RepID=UPI0029166CDE|nr:MULTISPECIES: hypothetical protein [unclassified Bradyrhizobium]